MSHFETASVQMTYFEALLFFGLFLGGIRVSQGDPQTWCDPTLGCLEYTEEWYSSSRPINLRPHSRESINTRFYLNTREEPNPDIDYEVSADNLTTLLNSPFKANRSSKFIVHGYTESGKRQNVKDLARSLLTYGDFNVLRVDWENGARMPYLQAIANARVVGLEIGYLVNTMITTYELDPSTVHCIGHSLGGHVCGYSGGEINGMGRITGLDPSGSEYFIGMPPVVRLDPSDALFVDVLHTDGGSAGPLTRGTLQPLGNIDFYLNGGKNQPGCTSELASVPFFTSGNWIQEGKEALFCSHYRAVEFFLESLNNTSCTRTWIARECTNYTSFEKGSCFSCGDDNRKCAYLGIRADEYVAKSRQSVTFYIDTFDEKPYCGYQYQVAIITTNFNEAEPIVSGRLKIWLYGETDDDIEAVQITEYPEKIKHGEIKKYMFLSRIDVGNIVNIELEWNYEINIFDTETYCFGLICSRSLFVESVEISPLNYYPESKRLDYVVAGCSQDGTPTEIENGQRAAFSPSTSCEPQILNVTN